jgi:hypothetical protein
MTSSLFQIYQSCLTDLELEDLTFCRAEELKEDSKVDDEA